MERLEASLRSYAAASLPEPSTPWRHALFSVIDLETTGLDPETSEIISFAVVTVAAGQVSLEDARYELVRPRRMPDGETIRIHGLRRKDLAEAPPLEDAIPALLDGIAGRATVAHVASVEEGFLGAALEAHGAALRTPVIDTAELAGDLWRRRSWGRRISRQPVGLSDLARSLGLPVHRPHHADGDALTTAQVFMALATQLERFEPQTVASLQRLSTQPQRRARGTRRMRRATAALRRRAAGQLSRRSRRRAR